MSHTIAPLSEMADAELRDLYASADDTARRAVLDECARRDRLARLERAREALQQQRAEWWIAAHADYLAAEAECRGNLLSPAGEAAKVRGPGGSESPRFTDGFQMWLVSDRDAERFASEELRDWWRANGGRRTFGQWREQQAADKRAARESARSPITDMTDYESAWTTEGSRDEQHTGDCAAVDGPAEAGHGRVGAADTVRPDRGGQQRAAAEAGRVRYAGSVQPGRRVMTVTAPTVPGHAEARAAGCKHPRTRFGTDAQCGDCPARRLREAPASPMLPAPRDSAPPATAGGSVAVRTPAKPIDGARLADLADAWIGKHSHLTDAARHGIALWVMAQAFRMPDETRTMVWDKFPHLLFIARRPGSGKTTTMKVAGFLCAPYYFGIVANPTAAGLCFTIAHEHAVVCIDEGHRLIGPKGTRKADVVTIMCSSFEQDGSYLNGRGGKANRVPVYAPMMIAAKEDPFLTSAGEEIADVIERSHLIYMSKPPAGTELAPVTAATKAQGALIAEKMAQWAAQQMADAEQFSEAMETARAAAAGIGLTGRDADVWLAQFTVAAMCSPGHLKAACDAALELRRNQPAPGDDDDADPLADLEASLAGSLSSWGMTEVQDEDEDEWDDEEGGDEEAPLTPPSPAYEPPVTYRAFVAVQGQGTRPLVCDVTDPAFARQVCESTAEARALDRPLQWVQSADGKAWTAQGETDAVAWAVAAE